MSPRFDADVFRCVGGMTFPAAPLLKSLFIETPASEMRRSDAFYHFWHHVKQQYGHSAVI